LATIFDIINRKIITKIAQNILIIYVTTTLSINISIVETATSVSFPIAHSFIVLINIINKLSNYMLKTALCKENSRF